MKISEITLDTIATYLKLNICDLEEKERSELEMIKAGALAFVKSYTGYTIDELDKEEDITIATMVLIQDMYDDRTLLEDKDKVNLVLKSILGMHTNNLL